MFQVRDRRPGRRGATMLLLACVGGGVASATDLTVPGGLNLLENAEFDGSTTGWSSVPEFGFLDADHDACISGSARAEGVQNQFTFLYQEFAIPAAAEHLGFGVDVRFFDAPFAPASAGAAGTISIELAFFREPDCTDPAGGNGTITVDSGSVGPGWHRRGSSRGVPSDATCARFTLFWFWRGDPAWEWADFDGAYVHVAPPNTEPLFVNGFEVGTSGSTCRWSSAASLTEFP